MLSLLADALMLATRLDPLPRAQNLPGDKGKTRAK